MNWLYNFFFFFSLRVFDRLDLNLLNNFLSDWHNNLFTLRRSSFLEILLNLPKKVVILRAYDLIILFLFLSFGIHFILFRYLFFQNRDCYFYLLSSRLIARYLGQILLIIALIIFFLFLWLHIYNPRSSLRRQLLHLTGSLLPKGARVCLNEVDESLLVLLQLISEGSLDHQPRSLLAHTLVPQSFGHHVDGFRSEMVGRLGMMEVVLLVVCWQVGGKRDEDSRGLLEEAIQLHV